MKYLEAVKQLKGKLPTSVFLIYGEERYLIESVINQIIQVANKENPDEKNVTRFDLDEISLNDVMVEVETYPFFSEKKIIIANDAYFLTAKQKKSDIEHNVDLLLDYLTNPVDFSTLILVAPYEKIDQRKKITKQLKKLATTVNCAEVKEWEIDKWVTFLANKHNIYLDKVSEQYLVNETGTNLALLEREIEKLALYVGENGKVTLDIAEELVSHQGHATGLTLVDRVIAKDLKGVIRISRDLMKLNEEPIGLIGLLSSQLRTIYQVKILSRQGYRQQQMVKVLKVHPYVIKMSLEREKKFSLDSLYRYIEACAEADQAIKQGRMEKELAFEQLLYQLVNI